MISLREIVLCTATAIVSTSCSVGISAALDIPRDQYDATVRQLNIDQAEQILDLTDQVKTLRLITVSVATRPGPQVSRPVVFLDTDEQRYMQSRLSRLEQRTSALCAEVDGIGHRVLGC